MQTLTIGAYRATLAPTRDVGAFQAKLAKCNGKSRRLPLRDLRTKAGFPVFTPGMSTAEYVRLYSSGDGSQLKAWEWAQLNEEPCALYSGEDTCETLPEGFATWEDFDAAQSADAAPDGAPVAAPIETAPAEVAPPHYAIGDPLTTQSDARAPVDGERFRILERSRATYDNLWTCAEVSTARRAADVAQSIIAGWTGGERWAVCADSGAFLYGIGADGKPMSAAPVCAPVDPLPTQSDSVPVPGKLDAAPERIEPDIFIRRATSAERMGNAPRQRAMRSLVPMAGHTVMFKPYGHKGAGFYWVLDRRADTLPSESDNAAPIECEPVTDVADLDTHERPCAAPGLISYRARGNYGWIMIGAADDADAMREAMRSTHAPTNLQRWDGTAYVPCDHEAATPATHSEPEKALPYAGFDPVRGAVYRAHIETAKHSRAIDPTFSGMLRRPRSAGFMDDFMAPEVRAHRNAIAAMVRACRAKRASVPLPADTGPLTTDTGADLGEQSAHRIGRESFERGEAMMSDASLRRAFGSQAERDAYYRGYDDAERAARPAPATHSEPAPLPGKSEPAADPFDAWQAAPNDPKPTFGAYSYAKRTGRTVVAYCGGGRIQSCAKAAGMRYVHRAKGFVGTPRQAEKMRAAWLAGAMRNAQRAKDGVAEPGSLRAMLESLAVPTHAPLPGDTKPEALDDDETIPAPLDGLDVAELDGLAEFERAGGEVKPTAPAYRDDALCATPIPSLRIPAGDPRARIPARFARVYLLQA